MIISAHKKLIGSKEVLEITGISRATLNNYIKMGIIPKPIVLTPSGGGGRPSRMGYFPRAVVERIEMVKLLKKEGLGIEDIAIKFKKLPLKEATVDLTELEPRGQETVSRGSEKELRLTLEDISSPAYLLNYNFELEWINHDAELRLFAQPLSTISDLESRNIFKVLFNWEFHNHVRNWEDLVSFHMSFAKIKFSKAWIEKLYRGISETQVGVLKKIYESVSTPPRRGVNYTNIKLILGDGTTEAYNVYAIFFKEGIFFVYSVAGSDLLTIDPVGLFLRSGMSFSSVKDSARLSSTSKASGKGVIEEKGPSDPFNGNAERK